MTFGAAGLLVATLAFESDPEESQALSEKVRGILGAITYSNHEQAVRELGRLGPAALPAITSEIERLHGDALAIAVQSAEASDHRPAAAIVARRLAEPEHGEGVMRALLSAVGNLGGDAEVPALTAVANSPQRPYEWKRLRAFLALVAIRSEKSVAAAIAALNEQRPARPRMPSAAAFADVIGRPVDEDARARAGDRGDYIEYLRLERGQGAAKVALPAGRTLLVFPDRWLGIFRDLWAQEFGAAGHPDGPALFLGVTLEGWLCPHECPIAAELRGDILSLRRVDTWDAQGTIDLRDVQRDSDGDGFSDLVERRLSLDPRSPDSDGDGLADAVDPVPNAKTRLAWTEGEQITAAIFEQFYAFMDETGQPAVFVGPPSQPLEGRKGPTLVTAPAHEERARGRYPGLPFIRITPNEDGGGVSPGERRYFLSESKGPQSGASYNVIVARVSGRWLVRSVELHMMR